MKSQVIFKKNYILFKKSFKIFIKHSFMNAY